MSRINILGIETRGVDMKSSPLLLGNTKLHAATNVVFEESVVRTRPGFRYYNLVAQGQFQGASAYRPNEGLSADLSVEGTVHDAGLQPPRRSLSISQGDCCEGSGLSATQQVLIENALQPIDISTLAKLNALVLDADLIDTDDVRLSDARAIKPDLYEDPTIILDGGLL